MKKKLFSKNKFTKENVVKFFDKEGFYVVVFLCLAVIATTAVYITRDSMSPISQGDDDTEIAEHEYYQPEDFEPEDDGEQASAIVDEDNEDDEKEEKAQEQESSEPAENQEKVVESAPEVQKEVTTEQDIPNATEVMSPNVEEEKKAPSTDASTAQGILNNLSNPVTSSTITMDYSFQAAPVFSATLNEFRSDHQGIDISAEKGTVVKAAMDGKVEDILEDPRLGMTVVIDHGSGVKTKYSNLDADVKVTKNQTLKKGDEIGKAGNTAAFEIDDEPHIHFEVWNGDKSVDPKQYVKGLE